MVNAIDSYIVSFIRYALGLKPAYGRNHAINIVFNNIDVKVVEKIGNTYKCMLCGKTTTSKFGMYMHLYRQHYYDIHDIIVDMCINNMKRRSYPKFCNIQ